MIYASALKDVGDVNSSLARRGVSAGQETDEASLVEQL